MSTTSTNTLWTFTIAGASFTEVLGTSLTFQVSGNGNHPATWSDSAAITLASDLQAALIKAGFTDATCTVIKDATSDTSYTVTNGAFA